MLALALLLVAAPGSPGAAALAEAEKELALADFERCGRLAQEALASGTLGPDEVVRAWMTRGRCYARLGDDDRAERSFAVATRVTGDLPALLAGPAAQEPPFMAAARTTPTTPLTATVRAAAPAEDGTADIEVALAGDDLGLVAHARLARGDVEEARFPLTAQAPGHRVSGLSPAGLSLALLDKHGNALRVVAVAPAAPVARKEREIVVEGGAPAREPTMLTAFGASALGLGLVGAVVSGVGVASSGPDPFEDGGLWLVGMGAATGVFLVGGALVVVDQGL